MNDQLGEIGVHDGVGGGASFVLTFAEPSDLVAQSARHLALTRLDNAPALPEATPA